MGFWDKAGREFKNAVEEGCRAVRDGVETANLRLRLHALQKKTRGLMAELGAVVYGMGNTPWENPLARPDVQRLIAEIKKTEADSEIIAAEIKQTGKK
ncbi:MAG: hypothetical protein HY894_10255 [Deltaproteobacteria bacterium]|nr:hypothetical protein [Deltaproteobacteria bacterium]